MDQRLAEIERLLRIAEDDLSQLQRQREFLFDQARPRNCGSGSREKHSHE
jgi:hypothetical protein